MTAARPQVTLSPRPGSGHSATLASMPAGRGVEERTVADAFHAGDDAALRAAYDAAAVVALAVAATVLLVGREPGLSLVADVTLEPLAEVGPATARLLEGVEAAHARGRDVRAA